MHLYYVFHFFFSSFLNHIVCMSSTLPFYVDCLPPSYSAVMAEKESSIHWEINVRICMRGITIDFRDMY